MPERVLVTGATGFVGSHIAQAFVEAGHEVRCGVRTSSNLRWVSNLAVERVPLDLTGSEDLPRTLENIDVIVHAAGITRARRTSDYYSVNAEGTRRLAAAAAKAGVRRFVLISSLAARGPDTRTEDGQDRPASAYGRSKLRAEEYLRVFSGRMEIVALRLAAVYGPRDIDLLPLFRMAARGLLVIPSGPGRLQPVYASDVGRAAVAAIRKPGDFGPYPVAETSRYTWQEVSSGLSRALGRPVRAISLSASIFKLAGRAAERAAKLLGAVPTFDKRRAQDLAVHTWTCDPSLTEEALGWQANVDLSEGLESTARWYRQAGWL